MKKPRWANKQLIIDYSKVFNSDEGKRVLADLCKKAPLVRGSINITNGVDVNKLLVLEGERRVVQHIYTMLKRDPNEEVAERAVSERQGE